MVQRTFGIMIGLLLGLAACDDRSFVVGDGSGGASWDTCGTCASAFTNGGTPCGGTDSSDAFDALLACACDACLVACRPSLCASMSSDQACGECLEVACAAEQAECAAR